jgi:hypothetical protein
MLDANIYKEVFSAIAFVLTFALFIPYIRSIHRGLTVPHVFSWLIWAFGTFIVFFAQLSDGAGVGAWPIGFSACITSYIAILAYTKRERTSISTMDWTFFALALFAIPFWAATADPLWAVILLTTANLIGFGPTLRRAYAHPYQEHAGFFLFAGIRNTFVLLALEHYSWTTMLFPAALGVASLFVACFLMVRRATVRIDAEIVR